MTAGSADEDLTQHAFPFDARAGGGRDRVLDGLRTVAVLAVILGHAILFRYNSLASALPKSLDAAAGSLAVTGVQIFFIISGYVITRLLIKEQRRHGQVNIRSFYFRRFFRIFPPLLAYISFIFALSLSGYLHVEAQSLLAALTFTCNTGLFECEWFGGHTWSLAVEEQFYLIWPAIFVLSGERYRITAITVIVVALMMISVSRGYVFTGNDQSFTYIGIGALVASSGRLQRIVIDHVGGAALAIAALALAAAILFSPDTVKLVAKPVLLAILVFGVGNVRWLAAMLETRPFQVIGLTSYSAYLWQELFLAQPSAYGGSPPFIALLPVVVWLSWRFVERPCMDLGRAYGNKLFAPRPSLESQAAGS